MKEQPQFRLSSKFIYRTMQKVEETVLLRERESEWRILWMTIAAASALIGGWSVYGYSLERELKALCDKTCR